MIAAARELEVLHPGDHSGHGLVARLRTARGIAVYALGIAQPWKNHLGPTWCYLLDADGLTLVDTGFFGSLDSLESALKVAGFQLADIERIIVTHSHPDHDGNAYPLQQISGAELWCHEVYAHTLSVDLFALRQRMMEQFALELPRPEVPAWEEGRRAYLKRRPSLKVNRTVSDGESWGPLTFLYTPGHAADELCILLDGVMFCGDHLLPDITPHPSCCLYFQYLLPFLPPAYREGCYLGLHTYLQSVQRIAALEQDFLLLPAHRLYYRGQWWLCHKGRARQILTHHLRRLGRIARLAQAPDSLLNLTHRLFRPPLLRGWGMFQAITELLSHLEFLQATGDIEYIGRDVVRWLGTEHYR
ncbi:MAG: MBL fold metallo-hydrolase, partial [Chloroflexi bacterium]|nr:MBL fold metallo-hydrolase [Chloroflexota bacterium]